MNWLAITPKFDKLPLANDKLPLHVERALPLVAPGSQKIGWLKILKKSAVKMA